MTAVIFLYKHMSVEIIRANHMQYQNNSNVSNLCNFESCFYEIKRGIMNARHNNMLFDKHADKLLLVSKSFLLLITVKTAHYFICK